MEHSRIEPHSPDWYKIRQGRFTASEIWKLMTEPRAKKDTISKTAETYILEKVHERITGQTKMGIDNFATEWGNDNEPLAKKWYSKLTGRTVNEPYLISHPEIHDFICTPDGFVEDGLIEIKCPANGANHFKHCFITSPEYFKAEHPEYYWQMMCQMNITGAKWCDFVSFDPRVNSDLGMFIFRLDYQNEDGLRLEQKVKDALDLFRNYYTLFASGLNE